MKKIGLISDTHGFIDPKVFKHFENCDEIWHAGDFGTIQAADELAAFKPLKGVYGNIDGNDVRIQYPLDLIFEVEDLKVYITHIGGYPGRYSPHCREILDREKPNIFICGHSHILKVAKDPKRNNLLVMNPGAAGNHGFHKVKTLLRFTLDNGRITEMEAIELGKRGAL